jgi:hypothetical protein
VGGFYLLGMDSPREVEVFNVLRFHGLAPDHLNVFVQTTEGMKVGPFDGYAECGAAYEVDGVEVHTDPDQIRIDGLKGDRAEAIGVQLVRFIGSDITRRQPMLEGWAVTREAALGADALGLQVIHQPGRSCPCGHQPGAPVD